MNQTLGMTNMTAAVLARAELRARLDELDAHAAAGNAMNVQVLNALESSARHWAERVRHPALLRRLAKLFRLAGQHDRALLLFEAAFAIDPLDLWTAIGLSTALDSTGQTARAFDVLKPLLAQTEPKTAVLSRAAILAKKLGNLEECIAWRRQATQQDGSQLAAFISELTAAGHSAEALSHVRQALANRSDDPELAFRCYIGLRKFSPEDRESDAAAEWLADASLSRDEACQWRARLHRWEGRFEEALADIAKAVSEKPGDAHLLRERAQIALACGYWGRDAKMLLEGREVAAKMPELRASVDAADGLLKMFGGSLEGAATNPMAFAHVRTPESIFELVVDSVPEPNGWGERRGIVMIAPSLAAGGAERILATSFRHISRDPQFGWAKLYLCDLSSETGKDFYLPLTGLSDSDVIVLNRDCGPRPPLSWLSVGKAKLAQGIREQLDQDRPAIVHAWLEPLDIFAGLAAVLAGVPRIVLHTHNMVPLRLNESDCFLGRMRDCYRALLRRPEISLVCCAEAARQDYAEWLALPEAANLHVLHNGLSTQDVAAGGDPEPRSHVDTLFPRASALIGTAFRFTELKRPHRWVDAAALVLEKAPGCRFVMFGDGALRAATEDYIGKKGLTDCFLLPGLVNDLYRRLSQLDLFVLSSRTEALPNVLLEAQAAGVPVVAYDVGGVAETFVDGTTGILVREDTAEALASGVLKALSDPAWLARASEAGRAFVNTEFSTQRMIDRLSGILLRDNRSLQKGLPESLAAAG